MFAPLRGFGSLLFVSDTPLQGVCSLEVFGSFRYSHMARHISSDYLIAIIRYQKSGVSQTVAVYHQLNVGFYPAFKMGKRSWLDRVVTKSFG